jgi:hypothetical protein
VRAVLLHMLPLCLLLLLLLLLSYPATAAAF